jgi:hypothetical protein
VIGSGGRAELAARPLAATLRQAARSQSWRSAARSAPRPCAPRRPLTGGSPHASLRIGVQIPRQANCPERRIHFAKALTRQCVASRVDSPWGPSRSAGLCSRARSAPRRLTSRTLSERSEQRERSELCAAAKSEHRRAVRPQAGPAPSGRLSWPTFFGEAKNSRSAVGPRPDTFAQLTLAGRRSKHMAQAFIADARQWRLGIEKRLRNQLPSPHVGKNGAPCTWHVLSIWVALVA